MNEIWKDVVGYEGLYMVSNMGNVKSKNNYKRKSDIIMKKQRYCNGYNFVILSNKNRKSCMIHRLVALAFIENTHNKKEVNHIDGDKNNNCVYNLEWVSPHENSIHKYRELGTPGPRTGKYGESHGRARLINQYTKDGEYVRSWGSIIGVEKEIGVNRKSIQSNCCGKRISAGGFIWKYNND